jgi:hypothetical protein
MENRSRDLCSVVSPKGPFGVSGSDAVGMDGLGATHKEVSLYAAH